MRSILLQNVVTRSLVQFKNGLECLLLSLLHSGELPIREARTMRVWNIVKLEQQVVNVVMRCIMIVR